MKRVIIELDEVFSQTVENLLFYKWDYTERLYYWLCKKRFGNKKRANTVSLATSVFAQKQETRKRNLFVHNKRF